jgi:uncharacterized membrane protein
VATEPENATGTERIMAFSDGVFAIAITLLVLNINLPSHVHDLPRALRDLFPEYLSYAMSFLVIGIIWAQHHAIFGLIRRTDHVFLLINIVFLMWLAFLPFPAHVLGENLGKGDEKTAMILYAGTFLVGTIPFSLLWNYAAWGGRLLRPDADRHLVAVTTRSYNVGPVFYLVDLALAFVNATASFVLFFAIAVFYALSPLLRIGRSRIMRPLTRVIDDG